MTSAPSTDVPPLLLRAESLRQGEGVAHPLLLKDLVRAASFLIHRSRLRWA
jgi:hypothetical protein